MSRRLGPGMDISFQWSTFQKKLMLKKTKELASSWWVEGDHCGASIGVYWTGVACCAAPAKRSVHTTLSNLQGPERVQGLQLTCRRVCIDNLCDLLTVALPPHKCSKAAMQTRQRRRTRAKAPGCLLSWSDNPSTCSKRPWTRRRFLCDASPCGRAEMVHWVHPRTRLSTRWSFLRPKCRPEAAPEGPLLRMFVPSGDGWKGGCWPTPTRSHHTSIVGVP